MACGVCLGIVLICLIQAEHVGSSRASPGKSSAVSRYVGFSQQDGRLRRLDGSPQNGLRQASLSPRSSYKQAAASGAYSPGLSGAGNAQAARLFPRPNQQAAGWEVKSPAAPKKFQLSTAVASGSSMSKTSRKKNNPTGGVQKKPAVQGALPSGQRLPAALTSRDDYSFRPAQNPSAAGSKGPSFAAVQAQTFMSSPGRRVSLQYRPPGSAATGFRMPKPAYQRRDQNTRPSQSYLLKSPSSRAQSPPEASSGAGGTRRFAPTRSLTIPRRFGGAVIRRLSSSKQPAAAPVWKPQTPAAPPQRRAPHKQVAHLQGDKKLTKSRLF